MRGHSDWGHARLPRHTIAAVEHSAQSELPRYGALGYPCLRDGHTPYSSALFTPGIAG
jgi:hypothetical protein